MMDVGFSTDVRRSHAPLVLWSDTAAEKMTEEYIATRRPSVHKQAFEVFRAGTPLGGAVRSELLEELRSPLFVPNYDMLSDEEKKALADYPHPWVGTAPANYPLLDLSPTYVCQDWYSDLPLKAFICGSEPSESERAEIDELLSLEDPRPSRASEPECEVHPPVAELPFAKMADGFLRAVALLLRCCTGKMLALTANVPFLAVRQKSGCDRLFLFNPHAGAYVNARVTSQREIQSACVASTYPVLPVRFCEQEQTSGVYNFDAEPQEKHSFSLKILPDGVSIVDISYAPRPQPAQEKD
jgi:hypothetical protein